MEMFCKLNEIASTGTEKRKLKKLAYFHSGTSTGTKLENMLLFI